MEKAKTDRILEELCQNIGGDWLLLGGTLVQLIYDGERATEDIDLVHISHPTASRESVQNSLFQFTHKEWGIGSEFVNLSVEFFLNELSGWQTEVLPYRRGPRGQVLRPSLTLFCALKLRRGTELDLADIRSAVAKEGVQAFNWDKLHIWLTALQRQTLKNLLGQGP